MHRLESHKPLYRNLTPRQKRFVIEKCRDHRQEMYNKSGRSKSVLAKTDKLSTFELQVMLNELENTP